MCLGVLSFLFCSHQLMRLVVCPPPFFNTYELLYVVLDNSVFFSKWIYSSESSLRILFPISPLITGAFFWPYLSASFLKKNNLKLGLSSNYERMTVETTSFDTNILHRATDFFCNDSSISLFNKPHWKIKNHN